MTRLILASSILGLAAACATATEVAPTVQPAEIETASAEVLAVIPMPSAALDRDKTITRIAFGSCLKQEDDQSIWNTVAAAKPELFLFIGDNVYGDVWSKDPMMPELRKAYRTLAMSKPFSALRKSTPIMPIWDDHDYGLNDAGATFDLKYGGEALFEEAWALPGNDPRRARDGVYYAEIIGKPGERVQIIMLDTRFFRSDLKATDEHNAPGKERYIPDTDPAKTVLGEEQYIWLTEELQKPAELRLIVSSIQVLADGHGWEAWRTLPTDRERFYDVLKTSGAERIVLLSGDRHAAALYKSGTALTYPLYEITSSSLNAPASIWRAQSGETRIEDGPQRIGTMEFGPNFGMFSIDWDKEEFSMSLNGADGAALQSITLSFGDLENQD